MCEANEMTVAEIEQTGPAVLVAKLAEWAADMAVQGSVTEKLYEGCAKQLRESLAREDWFGAIRLAAEITKYQQWVNVTCAEADEEPNLLMAAWARRADQLLQGIESGKVVTAEGAESAEEINHRKKHETRHAGAKGKIR